MIELWIPLTIAGAFFRNLRSALQKHLKAHLSTAGATYVRFFYAWPFALLYVWCLSYFGSFEVPQPNTKFLIFCVLGGLSQIAFTFLLVWMFSFRNFAAGIIYSKTETAQVAVLGLLALSVADAKITWRNLVTSLFGKTTLIWLVCGAALGTSVVFFRGAALSLGDEGFLIQAATALAVAVLIQSVAMGIYRRHSRTGPDQSSTGPLAAIPVCRCCGCIGLDPLVFCLYPAERRLRAGARTDRTRFHDPRLGHFFPRKNKEHGARGRRNSDPDSDQRLITSANSASLARFRHGSRMSICS